MDTVDFQCLRYRETLVGGVGMHSGMTEINDFRHVVTTSMRWTSPNRLGTRANDSRRCRRPIARGVKQFGVELREIWLFCRGACRGACVLACAGLQQAPFAARTHARTCTHECRAAHAGAGAGSGSCEKRVRGRRERVKYSFRASGRTKQNNFSAPAGRHWKSTVYSPLYRTFPLP